MISINISNNQHIILVYTYRDEIEKNSNYLSIFIIILKIK